MAEDVNLALVLQPLSASGTLGESALPLSAPYVVQAFTPDPRTASKNSKCGSRENGSRLLTSYKPKARGFRHASRSCFGLMVSNVKELDSVT